MRIGTIIDLPQGGSQYGIVQDEYGNSVTVDKGELPEKALAGDKMAYKVSFFANKTGVTLKSVPEE